jgi:hypothetical protein
MPPFPEDWEKARGIQMIDYNGFLLFARASVEDVAGAIAEDADIWERHSLGQQVVVRRDALFVFRLRGHRWSVAAAQAFGRKPYGEKGHAWEKWLSRRLRQPVIVYGVSDTCGSIGYTLVEEGEVTEEFFAEDDGSSLPAPGQSWFTSVRRDFGLDQVANIYDFAGKFFVEQDVLEPGISFDYFFDHKPPKFGEMGLVKNPGFVSVAIPDWKECHSTPDIERVDYLVFNSI